MSLKEIKITKIGSFTLLVLISMVCMLALLACTHAEKSPPNEHVTKYLCGQGEDVRVTFFINEERALLERNGESIELQQKPSGSGFIYSNGPNTIRGKGGDLSLEIGRMLPIECKAL